MTYDANTGISNLYLNGNPKPANTAQFDKDKIAAGMATCAVDKFDLIYGSDVHNPANILIGEINYQPL